MKCPSCNTENRDERTQCYHCNTDLTVLRTILLRAKQYYNSGLEKAERGKYDEAIADLISAVSIYNDMPSAHNVLGTLYAKQEKWEMAIVQWQQTLSIDPTNKKAAEYLFKAKLQLEEPILYRQVRYSKTIITAMAIILGIVLMWHFRINSFDNQLQKAYELLNKSEYREAYRIIKPITQNKISYLHQREAFVFMVELNHVLDIKVNEAKQLLSQNQFEQGLKVTKYLRSLKIPLTEEETLKKTEESLLAGYIQDEIKKVDNFYHEKNDYVQSTTKLAALTLSQYGKKYSAMGDEELNVIRKDWFEKNYGIGLQYEQNKDYGKTAEMLTFINKEKWDKESQEKLESLQKKMNRDMALQDFANAKQLLAKNSVDEFIKFTGKMNQTYLTDTEKQWISQQITKVKSTPQKPAPAKKSK